MIVVVGQSSLERNEEAAEFKANIESATIKKFQGGFYTKELLNGEEHVAIIGL